MQTHSHCTSEDAKEMEIEEYQAWLPGETMGSLGQKKSGTILPCRVEWTGIIPEGFSYTSSTNVGNSDLPQSISICIVQVCKAIFQ